MGWQENGQDDLSPPSQNNRQQGVYLAIATHRKCTGENKTETCMFLEICSLTPWHIQMLTFPDIQIISITSEQLPELWRAVPSGQFPHPEEEQPRVTSAWQNHSPEGKRSAKFEAQSTSLEGLNIK